MKNGGHRPPLQSCRVRRNLLLGLGELRLEGGIATLVVSEAAFLFDVLVGLLTHGELN